MNEPTNEFKPILTIREAANEFSFPEFAVRTLAKQGAFPVIRVGTRTYITREIFEGFIKTGGEKQQIKKLSGVKI